MISSLFRSLSIATLLIMGSAAHAQIIMVSNAGLDGTGEAYVEYSTFFGSTYHWDRAQSFTTGVGSYTLNSIDLKLVGRNYDPSTFTVALYSDSGGDPGSLLATLTGNSDPNTAGTYTYTATGGYALDASTPYFMVASVPSGELGDQYSYRMSTDPSDSETTSVDSWTLGNGHHSRNNAGSGTWSFDSSSLIMSVTATAVPKPSTYAGIFGGLALIGTFLVRRRKSS